MMIFRHTSALAGALKTALCGADSVATYRCTAMYHAWDSCWLAGDAMSATHHEVVSLNEFPSGFFNGCSRPDDKAYGYVR